MDRTTVCLLIGALFILIGIVGGGVSLREIQIPRVPQWARIACVVVGLLFIGLPFLYDNDGDETARLRTEEPRATPSPDKPHIRITVVSPSGEEAEVTPIPDNAHLYVDLEVELDESVLPGDLYIVAADPDGDCYLVRKFLPVEEQPLPFYGEWCGKKAHVFIIKATDDLESVEEGHKLDCPSIEEILGSTSFKIPDIPGTCPDNGEADHGS